MFLDDQRTRGIYVNQFRDPLETRPYLVVRPTWVQAPACVLPVFSARSTLSMSWFKS